ncbi:tRNA-specific 2-thiouridylase MnmA [bacterium BMS3Bbin09]|nr:tRNA-specific 2-thiouridylase MnmA [bacterium BMS3Bbin09]
MSGGVDSSVAAYLLKKEGHEVIGLSFELWDSRDLKDSNVCCSVETIRLAKSVAHKLGIEHHTVDVRDAFYTHVIEDFCASYLKGTTPNPCILCNKHIKFDFLMKKAEELGADAIITGHYARTGTDKNRFLLKKGSDPKKDQSYVLYVMKQAELAKTLFPLGEMKKEETREIAKKLDLATAMRAESQEICFVGNDKYIDFIEKFSPESLQPGPIIDTSGKVIGEHKGIAFYTIGQRKRLGISSLSPHYVADIDLKTNMITVGSREDAMGKTLIIKDLNWISIESLPKPLPANVKIRSTMKEAKAVISPLWDKRVSIEFENLQWAPASGQSAVFYTGDLVIGGGIIE